MAKNREQDAKSARTRVTVSLPQGVANALELVAQEKMDGNSSRVINAALLELFERLPADLRKQVASLLLNDDPIANLRAQLSSPKGPRK